MSNLCWIRRDLRIHDHAALSKALDEGETTLVYVFDPHILDKLKHKDDRRVTFIMESLRELEKQVQKIGSSIVIRYGKPEVEIPKLARELKVTNVYYNRDYEPYAKERDSKVEKSLKKLNIHFERFKDVVFFEKHEVLSGTGNVYKVFTPYKNKWLENFEKTNRHIPNYKCKLRKLRVFKNSKNILKHNWFKEIGMIENLPLLPGGSQEGLKRLKKFQGQLEDYDRMRNFPALAGTSLLSVYLRYGNISIRDMIRLASSNNSQGARSWISEIIWRDFYQMILDAYPQVTKNAFKQEYDQIEFLGSSTDFKAWREGQTGFPIIDAAMRCLNKTGMMHNRLRMLVASFLCKTLLIDWRKGEAYFAQELLDFDLASNNGSWQWCAGTGSDSRPYFRIFNPYTQSEKFDYEGKFIRQWVPELAHLNNKQIHRPTKALSPDYPQAIVSYENNRIKCLNMYAVVKNT